MQLLRKYSSRYLVPIIGLFLGILPAHAQNGGQVTALGILDGSIHQIQPDSSVTVMDSAFFNPANAGKIDSTYGVQNQVTLMINEASTLYFRTAFSVTVVLRITYTNARGVTADTVHSFTVNYDSVGTYNARSSLVFNGAHAVTIQVVSDSSNVTTWDPTSVLLIKNQLTTTPGYLFSCTNTISNITLGTVSDSADELPVSWNPVQGANQYDLEWTWVDSSALADTSRGYWRYGPPPYSPTLIFRNNATRITTTGTSYNIPIIFDNTGTVFIRVRPVQTTVNSYAVTNAIWSSDASPSVMGSFTFRGHERPLDWQSNISFAEEGKRKVVVQYYDGSLRSRQMVSKDNTTNTTIVTETYYDYQGRPAIQVMPAPTLKTVINYTPFFNVGLNSAEYSQSDYDTLPNPGSFCSIHADSMSNVSGTSQYYSPNNPVASVGLNQFIPNAHDYPFTETEYMPDNTGRFKRQGGEGPYYQLGTGHETKYFYGTPDQNELDALFGTEVGDKSHYFKDMVRDANGQYSVSYMDMHGRTIATALAGLSPDSLAPIPSYNSKIITETLADSNAVSIVGQSMISQKSLLVPMADTFNFNYSFLPDVYNGANCQNQNICYTCRYDLNITITDDCNNQLLGGQPFTISRQNFSLSSLRNSCVDTATNLSFSVVLPEGSYTITKTLTVDPDVYNFYLDSIYLPNNTCTTIGQFISQQLAVAQAANPTCAPTCGQCDSSVGSWSQYLANYNKAIGLGPTDTTYQTEANAAYQTALSACSSLCQTTTAANDILSAMLQDVSPPYGQYADTSKAPGADIYSIFYVKPPANANDTSDYQPLYTLPEVVYLDVNGNPDSAYDAVSGLMVRPNELIPSEFAQSFRPSWANALLPYHPEYCKLQVMLANNSSFYYDRRMEAINTYQQAVDSGYINPTGAFPQYGSNTGNIDPLTATQMSQLNTMLSSFKQLSNFNVTLSLWQFSCVMAVCDSGSSSCILNYANNTDTAFSTTQMCPGDRDQAWRNFRELYLGAKQQLFYANFLSDQVIQQSSVCTPANSRAYPTEPKLTSLLSTHHRPQFSDAGTSMTYNGLGNYNGAGNSSAAASNVEVQAQTSLDSFYTTNCNAYVAQWQQQLSACTVYNPGDVTNIILPGLDSLCRHACDSAHPYGASTLPPGQTIMVEGMSCTSFQDIINHYNQLKGITDTLHCNAEVITSPLPYGNQPVYSSKPVYSRPSDCECSLINGLYSQYTLSTYGDTSFSAFLLRTQQITMSSSDLTTLLSMCSTSATAATCNYLSTPIYLPPVMQCYAGSTCARCQTIDSLYTLYIQQYPTDTPSISSNTDTAQVQKNILFQNFMNNRLGFNLAAWEYVQFMDTCVVHKADTTTTPAGNPPVAVERYFANGTGGYRLMSPAPNGGYYVTGQWEAGGFDKTAAKIARIGTNGNILWQQNYLNSATTGDAFEAIRATSDGGFIAAGQFYPTSTSSVWSLVVIRGDSLGNKLWQKAINFQGAYAWNAHDLIQTHDGNFALTAGWAYSEVYGYPPLEMVAKIDDSGNVLWAKGFCDSLNNESVANSISEINDTLFIAGSQSIGFNAEGGPTSRYGLFFKINENTRTLSTPVYLADTAATDTSQQGIYLEQFFPTSNGYRIKTLTNNGSMPGVVDIGFSGNLTSYHEFDAVNDFVQTNEVDVATSDGGWLHGAQYEGTGMDTSNYWHLWWTRFNPDWTTQWASQTTFPSIQQANQVVQNADGSFTVLGYDNNYSSDNMLFNLSSSGTDGCYTDTTFAIPVTNPSTVYQVNRPGLLGFDLTWTYTADTPVATLTGGIVANVVSCGGPYYINYNGPLLCGKAVPLLPPVAPDSTTACTDSTFFSETTGTALSNTYTDSLTGAFQQNYLSVCMNAYKHESFTVTHTQSEYHYTLYYYDQAGNLLKTVPPAGVAQNTDSTWLSQVRAARAAGTVLVPNHTLVTNYRYNTLDQVVAQHTPDGGTTDIWYDRLGRVALSENSRQQTNNQYSYTEYDIIGRIVQVGQLMSTVPATDTITRNDSSLLAWEASAMPSADQITVTTYDTAAYTILPELSPLNLRNRVTWRALYNHAADLLSGSDNHATATYYSYDILGNVDTLVQDFKLGSMANNGNRFKKLVYNFDLVSEKVDQVNYQHGCADAFYQNYLYDAENRITNVQSSTDSINWDNDAFYSYYAHGPLARTVLGQQQVQGINYAYTLQDWLKAINPAPYTSGLFTLRPDSNSNVVANTAYNLLLDYFNGDYNPISTAGGPDSGVSATLGPDYRALYNGNISSVGARIRGLSNPLLYNYQYDQLNRLIHMDAWNRTSTPWSAITKVSDFQENVAYDPNGNIQKYKRNGNNTFAGQPIGMDSLNYFYIPGTNQLDHITDSIPSPYPGYNDITSQSAGNYQYDSIGELTADANSDITNITWTVYGKIASITKSSDTTFLFTYDADGNRISKSVVHAGDTLTTWYVRDAQGSVLSIYTYGDPMINGADMTQTELDVYGNDRLGIWKRNVDVEINTPGMTDYMDSLGIADSLIFVRGNKLFELANHLGNVLVTISDKRYGISTDDSTVIYFNPEVVMANDYYPFGSLEPYRTYTENSGVDYRYGFDGKEKDDEIKGVGDQIDYGMRVYDPRVGRFMSVDPMEVSYPWYSPYHFAGDNPIEYLDLDGLEELDHRYKLVGTTARKGVLSQKSVDILNQVMNHMNVTKMTITSTGRTPLDQATIMYENLSNGKSSTYGAGGKSVIAVYNKMVKLGATKEQIIAAMVAQIIAFGPAKISIHLEDPKKMNAVDLGYNTLKNDIGITKRNELKEHLDNLAKQQVLHRFLNPANNPGEQAFHIEITNDGKAPQQASTASTPPAPAPQPKPNNNVYRNVPFPVIVPDNTRIQPPYPLPGRKKI